jgi:hypothetical protein
MILGSTMSGKSKSVAPFPVNSFRMNSSFASFADVASFADFASFVDTVPPSVDGATGDGSRARLLGVVGGADAAEPPHAAERARLVARPRASPQRRIDAAAHSRGGVTRSSVAIVRHYWV